MAAKITEVRINKKTGLVQIKTNKGPNYNLFGIEAKKFEARRNEHLNLRCEDESAANLMAAEDYIAGRLK